jgi:transposase-like protein
MLERVNKEIRRRTRVVGAFPDGSSALMLVGARLRYVAGSKWGQKRYLNMSLLTTSAMPSGSEASVSAQGRDKAQAQTA